MHGPYLKWTELQCLIWRYRLWAACPCLSWSTVAMYICKFEMYVYLRICSFNLNFRYMATHKQANWHTHVSCNAVPLVWGSLKLTRIKHSWIRNFVFLQSCIYVLALPPTHRVSLPSHFTPTSWLCVHEVTPNTLLLHFRRLDSVPEHPTLVKNIGPVPWPNCVELL